MAFTKAIISLMVLAFIGSTTAEILWQSCVMRQERVCEHQTMSITCPSGQTIEMVEASYGRSEGSNVCNPGGGDQSCHASTSLSVMQQRCDGQNSCSVSASNGIFGDPCVGTFKYLQVVYECRN